MSHILNYSINPEGDQEAIQQVLADITSDLNNDIDNLYSTGLDNDYGLVVIYLHSSQYWQLIYSRILTTLYGNNNVINIVNNQSRYSESYPDSYFITARLKMDNESSDYSRVVITSDQEVIDDVSDQLQDQLDDFNTSYGEVVLVKSKNNKNAVMLSLPNTSIKIMLESASRSNKSLNNQSFDLYNTTYNIVLSNNPGIFNQFSKKVNTKSDLVDLVNFIRNINN